MASTVLSFKSIGVRGMSLFVCLLVVSASVARGQEATTPPPSREQTPAAKPSGPVAPRAPGEIRALMPVAAPYASAQQPSTRPAPHAPASPRTPAAGPAQTPRPAPQAVPAPPAPPPRVVTVVHRLSGWKLLTWLAASGPTLEIDKLPSTSDVLTNIVAGFVAQDNRTVVARLPRAEVELESGPAPQLAHEFFAPPGAHETRQQEFTLVMADGRRVPAKFLGLDASTGLSMLEAAEPLVAGAQPFGDEGDTEDPSVGQLVRFYAPAPLDNKMSSAGTPPQSAGYIYLSIDQAEGKLTEVRRAPSGKPFKVVARAERITPAWTGAIATDGTGAVVGIVSQSGTGETQIVPVETMKLALERVRASGASVPQPWLGARGDAAYRSALEQWTQKGWKPEMAMPFIQNGQGVLLTSVAPGTPAATAGLRPGDVISRVGEREVRGIEDLSFFIKDAGVGKTVDFTVWRAFETAPLKFEVMLKGTQNPALATADRELFAARSKLYALNAEVQSFKLEVRRLTTDLRPSNDAVLTELHARLRETEESIASALSQVVEAEQRIAEASAYGNGPSPFAGATPRPGAIPSPLQTVGLRAVGLTARSAARLGAKGGVLVVAVRPESRAAASGLRAGDVVETIDGQSFSRLELRRRLLDSGATSITLGIVRERRRQSVTLSLAGDATPER